MVAFANRGGSIWLLVIVISCLQSGVVLAARKKVTLPEVVTDTVTTAVSGVVGGTTNTCNGRTTKRSTPANYPSYQSASDDTNVECLGESFQRPWESCPVFSGDTSSLYDCFSFDFTVQQMYINSIVSDYVFDDKYITLWNTFTYTASEANCSASWDGRTYTVTTYRSQIQGMSTGCRNALWINGTDDGVNTNVTCPYGSVMVGFRSRLCGLNGMGRKFWAKCCPLPSTAAQKYSCPSTGDMYPVTANDTYRWTVYKQSTIDLSCPTSTGAVTGFLTKTYYKDPGVNSMIDYSDKLFYSTCCTPTALCGDSCSSAKKKKNGICDDDCNTALCSYDGGDCCYSTCVGSSCGSSGYRCSDPAGSNDIPSNGFGCQSAVDCATGLECIKPSGSSVGWCKTPCASPSDPRDSNLTCKATYGNIPKGWKCRTGDNSSCASRFCSSYSGVYYCVDQCPCPDDVPVATVGTCSWYSPNVPNGKRSTSASACASQFVDGSGVCTFKIVWTTTPLGIYVYPNAQWNVYPAWLATPQLMEATNKPHTNAYAAFKVSSISGVWFYLGIESSGVCFGFLQVALYPTGIPTTILLALLTDQTQWGGASSGAISYTVVDFATNPRVQNMVLSGQAITLYGKLEAGTFTFGVVLATSMVEIYAVDLYPAQYTANIGIPSVDCVNFGGAGENIALQYSFLAAKSYMAYFPRRLIHPVYPVWVAGATKTLTVSLLNPWSHTTAVALTVTASFTLLTSSNIYTAEYEAASSLYSSVATVYAAGSDSSRRLQQLQPTCPDNTTCDTMLDVTNDHTNVDSSDIPYASRRLLATATGVCTIPIGGSACSFSVALAASGSYLVTYNLGTFETRFMEQNGDILQVYSTTAMILSPMPTYFVQDVPTPSIAIQRPQAAVTGQPYAFLAVIEYTSISKYPLATGVSVTLPTAQAAYLSNILACPDINGNIAAYIIDQPSQAGVVSFLASSATYPAEKVTVYFYPIKNAVTTASLKAAVASERLLGAVYRPHDTVDANLTAYIDTTWSIQPRLLNATTSLQRTLNVEQGPFVLVQNTDALALPLALSAPATVLVTLSATPVGLNIATPSINFYNTMSTSTTVTSSTIGTYTVSYAVSGQDVATIGSSIGTTAITVVGPITLTVSPSSLVLWATKTVATVTVSLTFSSPLQPTTNPQVTLQLPDTYGTGFGGSSSGKILTLNFTTQSISFTVTCSNSGFGTGTYPWTVGGTQGAIVTGYTGFSLPVTVYALRTWTNYIASTTTVLSQIYLGETISLSLIPSAAPLSGLPVTLTVTVNSTCLVTSPTSVVFTNATVSLPLTVIALSRASCSGTKATISFSMSGGGAEMYSNMPPIYNVQLISPPSISSILPIGAVMGTATNITLTGTNMVPGKTNTVVVAKVGSTTCTAFPTVATATTLLIECTVTVGTRTVNDVVIYYDGVSSQARQQFTWIGTTPSITSRAPQGGKKVGGTKVTITGVDLGPTGATPATFPNLAAKVGGLSCSNPQIIYFNPSNGATNLTCTTADGTSATGTDIVVTVPPNTDVTLSSSWIWLSPPNVTSIYPATGEQAGGYVVTVTGDGFSSSNSPVNHVYVDGVACIYQSTPAPNQIACKMTAYLDAVGSCKDVVVVVDDVSGVGLSLWSWSARPIIQSINTTGSPTVGGIAASLFGSFGAADRFTTDVDVGGFSVPDIDIVDVTSSTVIFKVPPGQGTGLNVKVTTTISTVVSFSPSNSLFSYYPPTLSNMQPQIVPTAGNYNVTFTGDNFGVAGLTDSMEIWIGNFQCPNVTVHDHTKATCLVPPGTGKNMFVVLEVAGQAGLNKSLLFSYAAPEVYDVQPREFNSSDTPAAVNITGANFGPDVDDISVYVQDSYGVAASCLSITLFNDSVVECIVPQGYGANLSAYVGVSSQVSNLSPLFGYYPPILFDVSNAVGPASGYDDPVVRSCHPITINGTNFGPTAKYKYTLVTVGTGECTITYFTPTLITCCIPPGFGSNLPVIVTVGGQSSAYNEWFSYAPPLILSLFPPYGPTYFDQSDPSAWIDIVVSGVNFGNPTVIEYSSDPVMYIGDYRCNETTVRSDSVVICSMPLGSGGEQNVTLFLGSTVSVLDSATPTFSYLPPSIAYIEPTQGRNDEQVLIMGSNFWTVKGYTPRVYFVTTSSPVQGECTDVTVLNDTAIVCITPNGMFWKDVIVSLDAQNSTQTIPFYFTPCPGGTIVNFTDESCPACPVGYWSPGNNYGNCNQCPENTFTNVTGSPNCTSCPLHSYAGMIGANSSSYCICAEGFWGDDGYQCEACADGGICPGGGVSYPMAGYFGVPGWRNDYWLCNPPAICTGNFTCSYGNLGRMCSECLPGFYKSGGACESCPADIIIIGLFCGISIAIVFALYLLSKSHSVSKLKILMAFAVTIGTFNSSTYNIPWPSMVSQFMTFMGGALKVDNIYRWGVECSMQTPFSFLTKFLLPALIPVISVVVFMLYYVFYRAHKKSIAGHKDERRMNKIAFKTMKNNCIRNILMIVIFFTPPVSNQVANIYDCQEFEESKFYMLSDLRQQCYTEEHTIMQGVGVIFLIVYPIGVPVALWFFLTRNKQNLHRRYFKARYGFLYTDYKKKYYYWQPLEMARQMYYAAAWILLTNFQDIARLLIASLVSAVYGLAYLKCMPFKDVKDGTLMVIGLLNVYLLSWCGLLLKMRSVASDSSDTFTLIMMATIGLSMLSTLVFAGWAQIRMLFALREYLKNVKVKEGKIEIQQKQEYNSSRDPVWLEEQKNIIEKHLNSLKKKKIVDIDVDSILAKKRTPGAT